MMQVAAVPNVNSNFCAIEIAKREKKILFPLMKTPISMTGIKPLDGFYIGFKLTVIIIFG